LRKKPTPTSKTYKTHKNDRAKTGQKARKKFSTLENTGNKSVFSRYTPSPRYIDYSG
jgi:hypothetical protein